MEKLTRGKAPETCCKSNCFKQEVGLDVLSAAFPNAGTVRE